MRRSRLTCFRAASRCSCSARSAPDDPDCSPMSASGVWVARMQQLARDEKIEAYVFPGGVAMQLFREIGAGRPGLFTHVGLGTFVDPRVEGGRMNKAAKDDLIEVVTIDGQELLRYRSFPVNSPG